MTFNKQHLYLLLFLPLVTRTFYSAAPTTSYVNKQIDNTAGIFYSNLGFAKISTNRFSLLAYTNV